MNMIKFKVLAFISFVIVISIFVVSWVMADGFLYEIGEKYGTSASYQHNEFWKVQAHVGIIYRRADTDYLEQDIIWTRQDRSAGKHRWNDTISFYLPMNQDDRKGKIVYRPFLPDSSSALFMRKFGYYFNADTVHLTTSERVKSFYFQTSELMTTSESNTEQSKISWNAKRGVLGVESKINWLPSFKIENGNYTLLDSLPPND